MWESILALVSGLSIAFVGIIFRSYNARLDKVENENKLIRENYTDRFDNINKKLDVMLDKIHCIDIKVESQASFYKAINENYKQKE